MLASTALGIKRTRKDDWFDTILDVDTELFVDPFTIFKETTGPWKVAHDRLVGHFNRAFILIAEGNRNPASTAHKKALALLEFREPHELCLGYTAKGTRGSGSSGRLAGLMAEAIVAARDHQVALFQVDGDAEAAAERLTAIAGFDPVVMAVPHPGRDRPPARYLLLPAEQAARWRAAAAAGGPVDLAAIIARLSPPP